MQALNGFSHFGQCPWYWPAYQDGSLRQIWRDEFGDRHQTVAQGHNGVFGEQAIAALGDHDGVQHDIACPVMGQSLGNHGGDLSGGYHTDLDRIDPDVVVDGVNLVRDKTGLDHLKGAYAAGVLGGECSDDRSAVGAER